MKCYLFIEQKTGTTKIIQYMSSRDQTGNPQVRLAHFLSPDGQALSHVASVNPYKIPVE